MSKHSLLILQMERPPQDLANTIGEQPAWFAQALGADIETQVIRPFLGDALPNGPSDTAAILTGSWSMVTDREDWSERTAAWLRTQIARGRPLLGVCYGHQLMAHAQGGRVDYHPRGREVGSQQIELAPDTPDDAVLGGLPARFAAQLSHEQSVLAPPPGAKVLGRSAHDAHQILRYGPHALSVQFHPEFTPQIMRTTIARRRAALSDEGRDVDAMLAAVEPTPHADTLLQQFVQRYVRV